MFYCAFFIGSDHFSCINWPLNFLVCCGVSTDILCPCFCWVMSFSSWLAGISWTLDIISLLEGAVYIFSSVSGLCFNYVYRVLLLHKSCFFMEWKLTVFSFVRRLTYNLTPNQGKTKETPIISVSFRLLVNKSFDTRILVMGHLVIISSGQSVLGVRI